MAIVRRKNSKYYYVEFMWNGKMVVRSSKSTNKRTAREFEYRLREQLVRDEMSQGKDITLKRALEMYADTKIGTSNHRNILIAIKHIDSCIDISIPLKDLTTEHAEIVKGFHLAKGKKGQTVKHIMNTLRGAYKYAKRLNYKVQYVEFPTIKIDRHRLRYLTEQEEEKLLKELTPSHKNFKQEQQDNYDIVVFLLDTGARWGEAARIEWKDVDLDRRTINLYRPKVQNESVFHMTNRLYNVLRRRFDNKQSDRYVFPAKDGGPRKYSTIAINKAIRRAGLQDVTMHTFRHTFASRLIQNGMTLYEVSKLLGHSSVTTTVIYSHLEHKDITKKAVEVLNDKQKITEAKC